MTPETRLALGAFTASGIAFVAHRARLLSASGALAAVACGAAVTRAGVAWGVAVIIFFVTAAALSRWRRASKERVTGDVVDKGGARDAWQVAANGGVVTACAVAAMAWPDPRWAIAGLASLAAATADTWATEVGTAIGGLPRSILGFAPVATGTSGAVSLAGTLAMVAGALLQGTVALRAGFAMEGAIAIVAGGVTGALVDTLLGATIQERRWCPTCARATEQRLHRCGTITRPFGGLGFMTNDAVNLTSTMAGALVAVAVHGALAR